MRRDKSHASELIGWLRASTTVTVRRSAAPLAELARRPHHLVATGFAAGLSAAPAPVYAALALAATAAAIAAAVARASHGRVLTGTALTVGAVVAGLALGLIRVSAIDAAAERGGPDGALISGTATLLEHPRPSQFGSSAAIRMTGGRANGATILARVDGPRRWPAGGEPGTIIRVRGVARTPAANGSFDWRAYLRRRGIAFELAVDELSDTGRRRSGLSGAIDSMRRRAEAALDARLTRAKSALARGMVLGQDELIDPLERDDFRRSGLAHVLAVSGQNVMLLCALALPLLAFCGATPRLRVAGLLCLIAVYVPLAGAGPSLQRAGIMGATGLVAMATGRTPSRWYALELAAAATLALNPRVAGDTGWQLSFAAVGGILLLARPLQSAMRGLPRMLAEGVAVTLAASLSTAPLIAHAFGTISLAGLVANVVALPVVAGIMWAGMLQCALAQLPGAHAAIELIGLVNGALLGALRWTVRTFAEAPGSSVTLPLSSRAGVVIAYALIGAAAAGVRRTARRVEPRASGAAAAWRRLTRQKRLATTALATGFVAVGWRYATAPPPAPARPTVSFLDVGQGDSTLIQDGAGASVLFDGGPPQARVYRQLKADGVRRLDLMVATHQSLDHQGGLHEVLDRIPTRFLLENGYGTRDPDFRRLLAEADARHVHHEPARAGQVLKVGGLRITVLSPPPRATAAPPPDDPNPYGIAAIVSEGDFDLWLSADAESDAILPLPLRPVEAMKVSHHGSEDPGLPQVLDRLHPQVAAIEVGAHNTYGHPAPSTIAALRRTVPHVYRTDTDGTIKLSLGPDGRLAVATAR